MPEMIRVRVKSTNALIWVNEHELNDTVEVCDHQPDQPVGGYAPKAHKNVRSTLPAASSSRRSSASTGNKPSSDRAGRTDAGESGTKKEGSK